MRDYEVVYIFRSDLEPEAIEKRLEGYHDPLEGAEITAVEHWGKRQLAYPIDGEASGYYVVVQFRGDPATLDAFERGVKHDEALLRHLVVLSEGELPTLPSTRGITIQVDEDDDEDDDEDEE